MGIDTNMIRFLLESRRDGVEFTESATLGRQKIRLSRGEIRRAFRYAGASIRDNELDDICRNTAGGTPGYAESLLAYLGAERHESIDVSAYEGATLIHDMNTTLSPSLRDRFSCLIDGGTLEHVFNVAAAFTNCMQMVKVGGHFLSMTPCNNFMGHGFYQFSPELFWSLLCEKNGFVIEKMYIFEWRPLATWYMVANPAALGKRVTLRNSRETQLLICARKIASLSFADSAVTPQQSDYKSIWDNSSTTDASSLKERLLAKLRNMHPELKAVVRRVKPYSAPFHRPFSEPFFKKYK